MEQQLHFKTSLAFRKEPNNESVHFKVDGQRFKCPRTIKLHTNVTYRIDVTFRPAQELENFNIFGTTLVMEEKVNEKSICAYSGFWTTSGIPLTKKGQRDQIPVTMKIKEKGTLKVVLQSKFYKEEDIHHCEWGDRVTCIEYECNANEHRNHVDIAKEKFQ